MNVNMEHMDPPPNPNHLPPYDTSAFQTAMEARAAICFEREVSFTVTHWTYEQLSAWQDTMSNIADALTNTDPVTVGTPIIASPGDMATAVAQWRGVGGELSTSIPVRFL